MLHRLRAALNHPVISILEVGLMGIGLREVMTRVDLLPGSAIWSFWAGITTIGQIIVVVGERLQRGTSRVLIRRAPGVALWSVAEFLTTRKTYRTIFQPLLADFHHEYFDALSKGRFGKARCLRVIYFFAFLKAAALNTTIKFLHSAWEIFMKA